jgi:hypothetical protein
MLTTRIADMPLVHNAVIQLSPFSVDFEAFGVTSALPALNKLRDISPGKHHGAGVVASKALLIS